MAGHTDRFAAIVTHASLWALDQFSPTTDHAYCWRREMTPEMTAANSPHRFVGRIATPTLVVHAASGYRVPIGEGLRRGTGCWAHRRCRPTRMAAVRTGSCTSQSENHWVMTPQHTKVWYQVVIVFLSEHALGESAELPEMLGVPSRL
ncbi:alpha/beta hydrolase family protein [Candidatus Mycobacterium methanotrophicum]|uniref:Prolyl oligopeptidase family serine peptidase n=1 Tax=Candidatus Mycobacterium methanotrophicum TaxID=2943498 RepID=A0ABY4QQE0_9MYCO|nr:prolyl oligopeptidase family serine peptidase [Candidatus Mycobacterium methanotrophicum]UQX12692.1 prolyl oligopeptidase family serine peptidase [Candidatus Mycobacterium methanotrophicum]